MNSVTIFLLAEDDPDDAYFVEEEFKNTPGHLQLRRVHDGEEAIEYLEGRRQFSDRHRFPVPHVILVDLKMPRLDGFGFLKWLRTQAPEKIRVLPVIVMSSSTEESDVNRAYELGANSYLVKPVNWYHFQERIKEFGVYWGEHNATPIVPQQPKRRIG